MSGRYNDRYNEKRPTLGFRVSPEVKDYLLELQDGSDKTISEIAENVMNDAMMNPNKNRSSNRNDDHSNKNDVDGKQPNDDLYKNGFNDGFKNGFNDGFKNGFNDGFKNGSNHAKKDIKNRLTKNSQKINDKINGRIKQHLENNKDTYGCYDCDYVQGSSFTKCPKCGYDNTFDDHPLGIGDSGIHIPIVSDILDFLDPEGEEKIGEDSRGEDSRGEDTKGLTFVGGNKSNNQIKKEKDQYQCCNCDYTQDSPFENCPSCGSGNTWD